MELFLEAGVDAYFLDLAHEFFVEPLVGVALRLRVWYRNERALRRSHSALVSVNAAASTALLRLAELDAHAVDRVARLAAKVGAFRPRAMRRACAQGDYAEARLDVGDFLQRSLCARSAS
ncbi:MAG: hypothetical protein U0Q16_04815 [Bryobacteraceae bacterium]